MTPKESKRFPPKVPPELCLPDAQPEARSQGKMDPEKRRQLGDSLPQRVEARSRTQGSSMPTAPAGRAPRPLGAACRDCSKTNNFGNLVFVLEPSRSPNRIMELWNKKTVPDAPVESQFPFLPSPELAKLQVTPPRQSHSSAPVLPI